MAKTRVLVVDDEETIRELVEYNLSKAGYEVSCVGTGEAALEKARSWEPKLVVLDLMLPGVDGLDVCRILKTDTRTAHIPVVMLTAKGDEADIVVGLELGADDYVTKPFSPRVLMARVKAVLRRGEMTGADEDAVIRIHDIEIRPDRYEVRVDGKKLDLTRTEFRLLHFLTRRPGWVFTRNQIIDAVRGEGYPVTDRSVDVHVVGLRKKLGGAGSYVETVRGVGYRFRE